MVQEERDYKVYPDRRYFFTMLVLLNTAVLLLLFLYIAHTRNVDGDEGLYLEAARLVAQGKKLYIDFFFQQMPLTPYFYAGWMKMFGFTIFSSRCLSALLTAGSAFFVFWYVARRTRSPLLLTLTGIFLFSNGLFLAWAPVIKTHPFNVFFLTASVVLLLEWKNSEAQKVGWIVGVGILAGLGVNSRLTLAPYIPLFALFIFIFSKNKRLKNLGVYFVAILLTSIPTLYYIFLDPQLFLRYNFYFHTKIFPRIASDEFRLTIAKNVFFQTQMVILMLGLYGGLLLESLKGWKKFIYSDQFFLAVVVLGFSLIHLFTATPFTQYFSAIIPLLIIALLPVLEKIVAFPASFRVCFLAPLVLVYLVFARPLFHFELDSIGSLNPLWKLDHIESAVRGLKKYIQPGEYCLTWWPGYAFLLNCQSVPGMENHMREHAIYNKISWKTLDKYKMRSGEEVIQDLSESKYPYVVYGVYLLNTPYKEYVDYLLDVNYRLEKQIKGVRLYVRRSPGVDPILEGGEWASRERVKMIGSRVPAEHLRLQKFRADRNRHP